MRDNFYDLWFYIYTDSPVDRYLRIYEVRNFEVLLYIHTAITNSLPAFINITLYQHSSFTSIQYDPLPAFNMTLYQHLIWPFTSI